MALNVVHDTADDIPEQYRDLYSEQDGKFVLTGVAGIKTQSDIDRLQSALEKERNEHKGTKEKFRPFAELNPEDVFAKLDRFEELEAAAHDKIDDDKLNEIAEKRAKTRLAPVERQLNQLTRENEELKGTLGQYQEKERVRTIHDATRQALVKAKVMDTAHDDALMLAERVFELTEDGKVVTKDGVGVTPGVDPEVWLSEMQPKRPHWWPQSTGGGARGSGGSGGFAENPWTAGHWNLTKQGQVLREQGREKADQMARAAGSHVGATRPPADKK